MERSHNDFSSCSIYDIKVGMENEKAYLSAVSQNIAITTATPSFLCPADEIESCIMCRKSIYSEMVSALCGGNILTIIVVRGVMNVFILQ